MSEAFFQSKANIPDTVMDKFRNYHALLLEWNPRINLVAPSTIDDAWNRHFLDSAQLAHAIRAQGDAGEAPSTSLVDLGSGAGFPGMVLAIMGIARVTLVERDTRKCAFLRNVAAQTKTEVEIVNVGAGTIEDRQFDIITARALADIASLLNLSAKLRKPSSLCWFLKGKNSDTEIHDAQKKWSFAVSKTQSITDPGGQLLRLSNIQPRSV